MKKLFPLRKEREDEENAIEKCKNFLHKYCHPIQIGTGLLFSTVGIAVTAAGVMYADGLNFVVQTIPQFPSYIANVASGVNATNPVDYMRDSYKGSMSEALETGWKLVPFSYCIGHYVGGKSREKIAAFLHRG